MLYSTPRQVILLTDQFNQQCTQDIYRHEIGATLDFFCQVLFFIFGAVRLCFMCLVLLNILWCLTPWWI